MENVKGRFSRIEDKLDTIHDRIANIDVTLAKQHVSLEEHIKRTALLEAQMEPVKKHVNMVSGALKLIGLVAAIIGALEVVLNIFGK